MFNFPSDYLLEYYILNLICGREAAIPSMTLIMGANLLKGNCSQFQPYSILLVQLDRWQFLFEIRIIFVVTSCGI